MATTTLPTARAPDPAGPVVRLAQNVGGRFVGDISGIAARALLVLALARLGGPHDVGLLVVTSTVAALALLPAIAGVDVWAAVEGAARTARRLHRNGSGVARPDEPVPATQAMPAVAAASTVVALVMLVAGVAAGGDAVLVLGGAGFLTLLTAPAWMLRAGFTGADRLRLVGWVGVADGILAVALGFGVVALGGGAWGALLGLAAGRAAALAVSVVLYRRHVGPLYASTALRESFGLMRRSISLAAMRPLTVGLQRMDTLLVGALAGAAAVGFYGAATNVTLSVPFVALAIAEAALPRLCHPDDDAARSASGGLIRLLALGSVPVTLAVFASAPFVVSVLYGANFAESIATMRVLALGIPLVFVDVALAMIVVVRGKAGWRTAALVAALAANVAANLVLIPKFGVLGAAWSTVGAEAVHLGVLAAALSKTRAAPDLTRELLPALVVGAASAALVLLGGGPGLAAGCAVAAAACIWSARRGLLRRVA